MDLKERNKVRGSIKDAIRILDSAPIKHDLNPTTVIIQITNRIPIAHLAIEIGLKALIAQGGGKEKRIHCLDVLYETLQECDGGSANFLREAFVDAVGFYGLDYNAKGFGHFRTLEAYLSKVGGSKAFQAIRYWPIEENTQIENPIRFVWLPVHREILCAFHCLFLQDGLETVSSRVESEFKVALSRLRGFPDTIEHESRKESQVSFKTWLDRNRGALRSALKEAFRDAFVSDIQDEFWSMSLCSAYNELKESADPATSYIIGTFSYLPKDSQIRTPDATPLVQWSDELCRVGIISTPAGTELGDIEKRPDNSWAIMPIDKAFTTDIAEDLEDAKYYLVNRHTSKINVTVNGVDKPLRIVGGPTVPDDAEWTSDIELYSPTTIELSFWDCRHNLKPQDEVSFEFQSRNRQWERRLYKGSIKSTEGHFTEGHFVVVLGTWASG